ncbi:MAG: tetratricopeptide repeat protein [Dehalococcoidia bacterium]
MTSEESTATARVTAEERTRLRKQMGDHAVKLAVASNWDEAVRVNKDYVRQFGDDSEGFNRLGKALSELGQVKEARKAYGRALEIDPTNVIAKRNVDRLATMRDAPSAEATRSQVDPKLFVEETGKTTTTRLVALDTAAVATLDAGDLLAVALAGNAVNVTTNAGQYVGMVEPKIGLRLSKLMAGGNQYAAALVSTARGVVRVIVRETHQDPSQIGRVSFPQTIGAETRVRPDIRRSVMRHQLTEDVDYSEDDEVLDEEEEEPQEEDRWSELSDDGDLGVDVNAHDDESNFD